MISLLGTFPSYTIYFDIKIIHQSIQTLHSHAPHCHYCYDISVDLVLIHNVTCYSRSVLLHNHVNMTLISRPLWLPKV